MELKQIETFLAVVHYRNMTKAAEALYITQSTASYRLKALEEELQTVLVVRKKGAQSIGLTPQGERFIEIAKEWLNVYQKTQAFCEASKVCNLRIAAPESLNWLMQNTYRQIREHDEDVKLSILTGNSDQILQMLRQNQVDLIFCYLPCTENGIKCREVGETPMIVVEKSRKRRESWPYISPEDLDIRNIVMLKNMGMDNPNTEKYLRAWFSGDYAVHMQLDSVNMLQSNMEEGDWCFLPEIGFERFGSELHLYHFQDPIPCIPYYRIQHENTDPRIERLLQSYL